METNIKIIRALWGNSEETISEIPSIPIYQNQVVFVWGENNEKILRERGYDVIPMKDKMPDIYNNYGGRFFRKLLALDEGLKRYGEVILLDWDCYILRELDNNFYKYLSEKPIQCPLYAQPKNIYESWDESFPADSKDKMSFYSLCEKNFNKYSWEIDDYLVTPNFGFVYSRDINLGKNLIDISNKYNLNGCIEEHAMYLYSNCEIDEYIEKYQPHFVKGVSDTMTNTNFYISNVQKRFNEYMESKIEIDLYLEHM